MSQNQRLLTRPEQIAGTPRAERADVPRDRRHYTLADKLAIVRESQQPGVSQASVSRKHNLGKNVLWTWRKSLGSFSFEPATEGKAAGLPDVATLHSRIAELERLLGQKAFEIEMLRGRLQGAGLVAVRARQAVADGAGPPGEHEWKPE